MAESAIHAHLRQIVTRHAPAVYSWGQEDCSYPCEWEGSADDHPSHVADQILSEFDVLYKAEWTPSVSRPEDHPDYWRNR